MVPGARICVEVLDWDRWFEDSAIGYANVPLRYGKHHNVKLPITDSGTGHRLSSEVVLTINFEESANFSKVMQCEVA